MQVAILCGGMGIRLKEETEFRPKPMVLIGEKPIIWHIMKIYAHYGFKEFVLCLGYKGEMIKEYFYNYMIMSSDFTIRLGDRDSINIHNSHYEKDWYVTLADTGLSTLKGARLKKIEKYIKDETFMVTYGDGLSNIDINKLLSFHKSHGKLATVTGINPTARFGELHIQGDQVLRFAEKPKVSTSMINGGYFVFNRKIFDYLEDNSDFDLEYGCLENLAIEGQLMVYKHENFWVCMDTIRDMEYLNELWTNDKAEWKVW